MKYFTLLVALHVFAPAFTQNYTNDKAAIKEVINSFFESLELQDADLYRSTMVADAQIWRLNNMQSPPDLDMRYSKDDIDDLKSDRIWKETALSFDIKVHKGMAVAWVPYTFEVDDEFSHCGVDIFTLMKTSGKWKIVSTAYTVDADGCDELE